MTEQERIETLIRAADAALERLDNAPDAGNPANETLRADIVALRARSVTALAEIGEPS